ncbi:hypothetical protein HHI36_004923 [Cryptolaemus montrouzieri]|uniref:FAS1 domain-containing protein n=1 Tax=Cryptolaemus montrouzieri TaxID=559131 RepID=A0ABD2NSX6_9CUCU
MKYALLKSYNLMTLYFSDDPFTIFAPQNAATKRIEILLQEPDAVKRILMNHVVIGSRLDLENITDELSFQTAGGRNVHVKLIKDGKLQANDAVIVKRKVVVPNGILVVLDNYLFHEEEFMKKNATIPVTKLADISALPLVHKEDSNHHYNTTFVENILEVLSFLKSGVRVFQHFLSRSNVSKLLKEGEEYTVFVPTDHAFQRWHPIDWGFYPFSVPEFTESVITNHFVRGRLKQDNIKDGQIVKTLGGKEIIFKRTPNLFVNGATIVKGDTPVAKGNIMFIGEVLFVSESVVSKLHQQHRDKETPPLLAFPWFGAQFLSHAFLALERDRRFSHITRFLNLADLAPHVSGTGYTFFVPIDTAFEELGLDKMPDNYLSNGQGLEILLNHFVKGRLYDKDLTDGSQLTTLGNKTVTIRRRDKVKVNEAAIVESEVFVYNLGTMFYIDKVLFATLSDLPSTTILSTTTDKTTQKPLAATTLGETESVPDELAEKSGQLPDILVSDDASTNKTQSAQPKNATQSVTIK